MRRLAFIPFVFLSFAALAQPAPQVYTLTVDNQQINLIGKALGELPYKDVAPVINALFNQVRAQEQERAAKAAPPEPPKVEPKTP